MVSGGRAGGYTWSCRGGKHTRWSRSGAWDYGYGRAKGVGPVSLGDGQRGGWRRRRRKAGGRARDRRTWGNREGGCRSQWDRWSTHSGRAQSEWVWATTVKTENNKDIDENEGGNTGGGGNLKRNQECETKGCRWIRALSDKSLELLRFFFSKLVSSAHHGCILC